MLIDVFLFGDMRTFGPVVPIDSDCKIQVELQAAGTIGDVVRRLGIDPTQIAHLFLNYQYSAITRLVKDGDRLGVFGRDMALLYRQYFPKQE
jgi:hypothetical protein